jgi:hypothetical protein
MRLSLFILGILHFLLKSYTVQQDGDDEGVLMLDRLPAPHEAAIIREATGIRKKRTISDESQGDARQPLVAESL